MYAVLLAASPGKTTCSPATVSAEGAQFNWRPSPAPNWRGMCSVMPREQLKVAVVYNLRPAQASPPTWPADLYAEWDEPGTIAAVQAALAMAHEVVLIENTSTVEAALCASAPDIVFNMAEGLTGVDREARIPALLERRGIPFTGSSARTLRTCLDKAAAKRVLQQHGLPTPAYTVISCAHRLPELPAFPLIVKPLHEGSSKGIEQASVVSTRAALQDRVAYVLATYRQPALVETFLSGREFTVALLGNGAEVTVLPLVEICFTALPPGALPLYSYAAKWLWDTPAQPLDILRYPVDLPAPLVQAIVDLCCHAFRALECRDWCRIDVRLDAHGQPQILELNPLPGILPNPQSHSCFPKAAAAAHISYAMLIQGVLAHACQRYGLPVRQETAEPPLPSPSL